MYTFENNKHNKDGPEEPNFVYDNDENNLPEGEIKKAFVAWPDKTSADNNVKIVEGRTKRGGYVAMPKNNTQPF